ncbi:MAG: ATP phosphoribosyltransferase regulatory subunit [Butyrivibrio sp.]|jgi:ATP phosphoribosyltransferase regulatory subunit|nr:ATP phosphoribosyltransferase regulatory subunit [Butyrivibrio sp.]
MNRELVHTPEGVRDIYGKECADRQVVQNQVHEAMKRFGYEDINTPTFEFFDVFAEEISATSARELYKFFDKEGNTLVLRPDFTPSVARCVSKYFLEDDQPVRICYSGNTFMNTTRLQGKLREYMQMGAELMNDDSVQADAEMISMMIQALSGSGLAEFQVSVGDADYYKGICEEAGIDEETEAELREQIAGKNYFAAEKILVDRNVPEKYRDMLLKVSEYVGSVDELEKAVSQVENSRSRQAVARLQELYRVLTMYGVEKYISFDLSMLSQYNYYTGVIFKAYTYGVGDAIAKGGRYDDLLSKFGRPAPAIGFMIVIDDLMSALYRQKIELPGVQERVIITYEPEEYAQALQKAQDLRDAGRYVVLQKKKLGGAV